MDAQRGLSVSGHRNTVLCLHLTSDTYHVTPSGRAPRARGKFWIRRVKLRIFRPDPKSHKSEGFPAAQIFKTHKCQNTYCRSAHFSKAVKFVGAQNPRGTPWFRSNTGVNCDVVGANINQRLRLNPDLPCTASRSADLQSSLISLYMRSSFVSAPLLRSASTRTAAPVSRMEFW